MSKTSKKSIVLGFKILSVLAFGVLIIPSIAAADAGTNVTFGNPGSNYSTYDNGQYYNQSVYQPPVYTPPPTPAATPIVYSNETNPNVANTTNTSTVTKAKSTSTTSAITTNTNSVSGLAANAVYGSNSFLPSGLVQWVLFAIFILLIVIMVRIIFGAKSKYLSTPLKHE